MNTSVLLVTYTEYLIGILFDMTDEFIYNTVQKSWPNAHLFIWLENKKHLEQFIETCKHENTVNKAK